MHFANTLQQDACEAFQKLFQACDQRDVRRLLQIVEENVGELSRERFTIPFWHLCGGVQKNVCKCTRPACMHKAQKYEPFACLQLAVDDPAIVTIEHAIARYHSEEMLADYRCDACQTHNVTQKLTTIAKWPPVLVVGLKRWHWNASRGQREKIARHIGFETILHCPGAQGPYTLRSVVVHDGAVGVGHYTARIRAQDNSWYLYNDSAAPRPISTDVALQGCAYILFYEKCL